MIRSLLAGFVLVVAACAAEVVQEEGPPPLYKYSSMKAAVESGKETLPAFWEALESGNADQSNFMLLVVTPSQRHTEEYVWVENVTEILTGYRGIVPDEHEMEDGFKGGDTIDFIASDIADWRYKEDGKYRGAFTTRAMMGLAPNANIDSIKALFHDEPLP